MLQNPNFMGLRLQRSSDPVTDGKGASCPPPPAKNATPLSTLRASLLRVSVSNPLQSWQPY